MITCRTCLKALQPYLDRELSDDDIVQVRAHLDECTGCFHLFEFETSVRRLVKVNCQSQQAPDGLRVRIAARLAAERARYDQRRPPQPL